VWIWNGDALAYGMSGYGALDKSALTDKADILYWRFVELG
jgi:hypothetical protein